MYNYGYNNGYVPYSQNQQPSYNAPNQAYNGFSAVPNGFNAQQNFAPQYPQNAPQTNAQSVPQMNTNKIYVTGIEDARARQLPPNSDFIFLDNDKPLLYRKTVDATGKMEIKAFKISEYTETEAAPASAPDVDMSQFVSVEEFKTVQTEMGRIKRTIDGLLKKEKKGGEENG